MAFFSLCTNVACQRFRFFFLCKGQAKQFFLLAFELKLVACHFNKIEALIVCKRNKNWLIVQT